MARLKYNELLKEYKLLKDQVWEQQKINEVLRKEVRALKRSIVELKEEAKKNKEKPAPLPKKEILPKPPRHSSKKISGW